MRPRRVHRSKQVIAADVIEINIDPVWSRFGQGGV